MKIQSVILTINFSHKMASKDPAFLFYPSDFLTGTMFMNHEQVGIYVRLLCSQHQHGGVIDKISFNTLVGSNDIVRSKFIEIDLGYFNERLANEMEKRNKKSNNISEAVKEVWKERKKYAIASKSDAIPLESKKKPKTIAMGIEDVNEIEVINYFINKGYKKDAAIKFYEYYNSAGWKDSNGKAVKNWKQKANAIWFKEENKATTTVKKMVM